VASLNQIADDCNTLLVAINKVVDHVNNEAGV
jgi:hypothetical protein